MSNNSGIFLKFIKGVCGFGKEITDLTAKNKTVLIIHSEAAVLVQKLMQQQDQRVDMVTLQGIQTLQLGKHGKAPFIVMPVELLSVVIDIRFMSEISDIVIDETSIEGFGNMNVVAYALGMFNTEGQRSLTVIMKHHVSEHNAQRAKVKVVSALTTGKQLACPDVEWCFEQTPPVHQSHHRVGPVEIIPSRFIHPGAAACNEAGSLKAPTMAEAHILLDGATDDFKGDVITCTLGKHTMPKANLTGFEALFGLIGDGLTEQNHKAEDVKEEQVLTELNFTPITTQIYDALLKAKKKQQAKRSEPTQAMKDLWKETEVKEDEMMPFGDIQDWVTAGEYLFPQQSSKEEAPESPKSSMMEILGVDKDTQDVITVIKSLYGKGGYGRMFTGEDASALGTIVNAFNKVTGNTLRIEPGRVIDDRLAVTLIDHAADIAKYLRK